MELRGRSAVVTGGAGGLGEATVRRLVGAGMHVVVFDHAEAPTKELASRLDGTSAVCGDVNDDADVHRAIAAAASAGPYSLLVNVAGGGVGGRTVARDGAPLPMSDFSSVVALNALGTFNVTRLSAAAMAGNEVDEQGQRGVVVNTGSVAGLEGQAGQVAYAAAKAAILGMTLPLARDLAPLGIRVCAIAPGTMGTPIMQTAPAALTERLISSIVFPKRMGFPDEFAQLVEAIASNDYLNGENIRLDGALRFPPK
jgi:NAD(P)-dependent dehydrogenase (short-subunit alcohol dehydrogenase family)